MRHIVLVGGLAAALLAGPVFADTRIAVVDTQVVFASSDATKKVGEKLNNETKVQRDRMDKLKAEIQGLQAKFQKDGAVMTEKDKKDLQKQGDAKLSEYQKLAQTVLEDKQKAEQSLQENLIPKIRDIIEDLRKTNKYDLVLEKQSAVLAADPALDLTKKVVERLNAVTADK